MNSHKRKPASKSLLLAAALLLAGCATPPLPSMQPELKPKLHVTPLAPEVQAISAQRSTDYSEKVQDYSRAVSIWQERVNAALPAATRK